MIINMLRKILSLLFIFNCSITFGQSTIQQLFNSEGWELIDKYDNGSEFSVKSLDGKHLEAVMIANIVPLDAQTVLEVVYDIDNYDEIFLSSQQVSTTVLKSTARFTDAYQHLPVPIPFISDRHYIFRMHSINDNRVTWTLISHNNVYEAFLKERDIEFNKPVYLPSGYGIWDAINNGDKSCRLSYKVYMDSGGNLPDFLIEWLNKKALANIFQDVIVEASSRSNQLNH